MAMLGDVLTGRRIVGSRSPHLHPESLPRERGGPGGSSGGRSRTGWASIPLRCSRMLSGCDAGSDSPMRTFRSSASRSRSGPPSVMRCNLTMIDGAGKRTGIRRCRVSRAGDCACTTRAPCGDGFRARSGSRRASAFSGARGSCRRRGVRIGADVEIPGIRNSGSLFDLPFSVSCLREREPSSLAGFLVLASNFEHADGPGSPIGADRETGEGKVPDMRGWRA